MVWQSIASFGFSKTSLQENHHNNMPRFLFPSIHPMNWFSSTYASPAKKTNLSVSWQHFSQNDSGRNERWWFRKVVTQYQQVTSLIHNQANFIPKLEELFQMNSHISIKATISIKQSNKLEFPGYIILSVTVKDWFF